MIDVTAREVMRFEWIAWDIDAGFDRGNAVIDDHSDRHFAQPHPDHFSERDRSICDPRANPEPEEIEKDDAKNESDDRDDRDADKIKRVHGQRYGKQLGAESLIGRRAAKHLAELEIEWRERRNFRNRNSGAE